MYLKYLLTNKKSTTNLAISPNIRPSDICNGPSSSWDGMMYVVRAKLNMLATANRMSDMISGSSGDQEKRAAEVGNEKEKRT